MKRWRRDFFLVAAIGCGLFVLLTGAAMLLYPGGSHMNRAQVGYSFTYNFLSDLGLRHTPNGQPNPVAGGLFFVALALAGLTLALFFIRFRRFYRRTLRQRVLSLIGTLLGVGAGISFIGVAFTPADIYREAHVQFVMWAFSLFPLAVLCYTLVMAEGRALQRGYTCVFLAFFGLLAGYYLLITQGPEFGTANGYVIQTLGQKIIVYASITAVCIVALGAWQKEKSEVGAVEQNRLPVSH